MAAAPKLTPEQWVALRVEYEAGLTSLSVLAEKYGVSRAAIRKRANDGSQPGGAWRRDEQGATLAEAARVAKVRLAKELRDKARKEGSRRQGSSDENGGEEGSSEGSVEPFIPVAVPLLPAYQNPVVGEMADPAYRASLRDEIIDGVASALAKANSEHLENRVGPLKTLFMRLLHLASEALMTPDATDTAALERQQRAQAALIVGRSDTMGAHLQAIIKLSESIQAQERRAFGVDDRAKRVELTGAGGAPIQTEHVAVHDLSKLSTEDMKRLYEAALILEGGRERPPVPSPPGDA